jgi:hypothetical protein
MQRFGVTWLGVVILKNLDQSFLPYHIELQTLVMRSIGIIISSFNNLNMHSSKVRPL